MFETYFFILFLHFLVKDAKPFQATLTYSSIVYNEEVKKKKHKFFVNQRLNFQ